MIQNVDVDVDGVPTAIAYLQGMKIRMDDYSVPFAGARQLLAAHNAENFTSNGLPVGGWSPLDAQYGSWKSRNFPGAPPMVRTGKLFESLTSLRGGVNVVRPTSAEFGTTVEYAKFHQYGTNKMPKRQLIFDPPEFAKVFSERVAKWVAEGLI